MTGTVLACLLAVTTVSCSGDDTPPPPEPTPTASAAPPSYDATLEPAAAVLALVPDAVTTLTVTDYDEVRATLGLESLTGASPVAEQDAFWTQADAGSPLLSDGMLRPVEARLRAGYGLSQTDVAWEAHLFDDAGDEVGFAMSVREGVDPAAVQRAVSDGVGPLAGSTWRPDDRLVVRGTTDDGTDSWAADPDLVALVGLPANATYVARGCETRADVPADLEPLEQWSLQLEGTLATARLGPDRLDLFDRLRMATSFRPFRKAYEGGVADPLTGRLGFRMVDPPLAADQARRRRLPFAACAEG